MDETNKKPQGPQETPNSPDKPIEGQVSEENKVVFADPMGDPDPIPTPIKRPRFNYLIVLLVLVIIILGIFWGVKSCGRFDEMAQLMI